MSSTLLRSVRIHDHQIGEDIRSVGHRVGGIIRVVVIGGERLSGSWTPLVGLVATHSMALIVGRGHGRRISEGRTDGE